MGPYEHYREAEKLLSDSAEYAGSFEEQHVMLRRAQVHATLATVAPPVTVSAGPPAAPKRPATYDDPEQ